MKRIYWINQAINYLFSSTPLAHVSFDWDEKGPATFHHPRPPMAHIGRDGTLADQWTISTKFPLEEVTGGFDGGPNRTILEFHSKMKSTIFFLISIK